MGGRPVVHGPTPLFIEIFTHASPATTDVLFGGVLVAGLTGFITAAILAVAYGAWSSFERVRPILE